MPKPFPSWRRSAFTLVELLAVVAIMVLLMAFVVPVVSGIKGGRDVISKAYGIAGALEQARTYAMANNTYAWVGFFEEDGNSLWNSTGTATSGTGRVIVSVVASRDGSRYGALVSGTTFGTGALTVTSGTVPLLQVGNLLKFDNTHLAAANSGDTINNSGNDPQRPGIAAAYQVGSSGFVPTNPLSFNYPLVGTGKYTFTKIIEFNPLGEANKIKEALTTSSPAWMEVAIQPSRGNQVDAKFSGQRAAAAILVNGLSGQVQVFKP